jgi:hypothetical protein
LTDALVSILPHSSVDIELDTDTESL